MRQRVLVPLDFFPGSEKALRHAADLVQATGGTLEVLHVVPRLHQLDPFFRAGLLPEQMVESIRERAGRRLAQLLRRRRLRWRLDVVEGDPVRCILREIERRKPALVVVGTHARRGAARLFLGSVAEKVVQASAAPVLTVPHVRRKRAAPR